VRKNIYFKISLIIFLFTSSGLVGAQLKPNPYRNKNKAENSNNSKSSKVTQKNSTAVLKEKEKEKEIDRSIASGKTYSREAFYLDAKAELEKSLKKVVHSRVEKTVKLSLLLSGAQDRWSLTNTLKGTEATFDPKYREYTSTTTLKFADQNGFSFSTYADLYDNSAWQTRSTRDSHTNLGFNFSQELISGWSRSKFAADQDLAKLEGEGRLLSADGNYLNETLKVIDLSLGLYSTYCKKKDLEKLHGFAKETLKITEVQHAAKTISTRDLLRIQETYNNMLKQMQAIENEIKNYENGFSGISVEAFNLAQKIEKSNLICEENVANVNKVEYPDRGKIPEILKKHPTMRSFEIQKDSTKKQMEIYKIQRRPSLALQSGMERAFNVNTSGNNPPYNNYYVGLNFSYQFQGDQAQYYKQTLAEQFTDISIAQKQTQMDLGNYLASIYDTIEYSKAQIPLAQKSLENSSRLLKIIQTQQQIGQLDATAIESAYSSYSSAIANIREIVSQVSSNALKLNEISR
jgi:outer membrane protein TolC